MINLNDIARKAEQMKRENERKMKTAYFLKGVLATIAFFAFFYAAVEIPAWVHSRDCDGCDWFWCNNYNGK